MEGRKVPERDRCRPARVHARGVEVDAHEVGAEVERPAVDDRPLLLHLDVGVSLDGPAVEEAREPGRLGSAGARHAHEAVLTVEGLGPIDLSHPTPPSTRSR
ncbi:MAG: hypothetical protein ACLTSX_00800 [Collinsella sp.]